MSTIPIPFAGDTIELIKRVTRQPDQGHITAFMHDHFGYEAPGCIGMFWPHNMELIISDPDYLQDLFVTYNDHFDKEGYARKLFSTLFWDSIIWAKSSDPTYKPRRKLISHAFYSNKLRAMSDTIFEVIHKRLLEWPKAFPDGQLDLVEELISIQGQIVLSTSLGPEYVTRQLPFEDYKTGKTESIRVGMFMNNLVLAGATRDS